MKKNIIYLVLSVMISSIVWAQSSLGDIQKLSQSELEKLKSELSKDLSVNQENLKIIKPETPQIEPISIGKKNPSESPEKNYPYFAYSYFSRDIDFFDNIPSPIDYRVGPGDSIIISLWGEENFRQEFSISKQGTIYFDNVGFINLSNKTLDDVKEVLLLKLSSIFSTLNDKDNPTYLDVEIGKIKSVNVYYTGEVTNPGIHLIHPFSDVFTSLVQIGGVNINGSLRKIQVIRNGAIIETIDLYSFFKEGKMSFKNTKIIDNDIIHIPTVEKRVLIKGAINNPGYYEILDDENFSNLSYYAGGLRFNSSSDIFIESTIPSNQLEIQGNDNRLRISNLKIDTIDEYKFLDGDNINVVPVLSQKKQVTVVGRVKNPGVYSIEDKSSLKMILDFAGGFEDETFRQSIKMNGILVSRPNNEGFYSEEFIVSYADSDKFILSRNDVISVYEISDYFNKEDIRVSGEVLYPGTFPWEANLSINDLLEKAGGVNIIAYIDGLKVLNEKKELVLSTDINSYVYPGYEIIVPKIINYVSVNGAVRLPGNFEYVKRENARAYIELAGGRIDNTQNKIVVEKSNGNRSVVSKFGSNFYKISQGDKIIVYEKDIDRMDTTALASDVLSIISSLVTALILVDNINKN